MSSWIPKDVAEDWHFSCNSKGWTNNIHGEQWVEKCFDAATQEKANGQYRLLICDGHDSHISAQFVRYCIDHRIVVFLLPPHASHILQPLDVGVFGPLKTAMATHLSRLLATEIARLQKVEWVDKYIPARVRSITVSNIQGGWRGAGLFPLNRHRILRTLSEPSTLSSPEQIETTTSYLINSSPPDVVTLRSANKRFNEALASTALATPIRRHGQKLSGIAKHLHADNSMLRHENAELKSVIRTRKERLSGKRIVLKGKFVVTTEEIQKGLAEAERKTKKSRAKGKKRRARSISEESEIEVMEVLNDSEAEECEMQDCITVQ